MNKNNKINQQYDLSANINNINKLVDNASNIIKDLSSNAMTQINNIGANLNKNNIRNKLDTSMVNLLEKELKDLIEGVQSQLIKQQDILAEALSSQIHKQE